MLFFVFCFFFKKQWPFLQSCAEKRVVDIVAHRLGGGGGGCMAYLRGTKKTCIIIINARLKSNTKMHDRKDRAVAFTL